MMGRGYSSVVERLAYNILGSIRLTEKNLSYLKPKVIIKYVLQEYMEGKEQTNF